MVYPGNDSTYKYYLEKNGGQDSHPSLDMSNNNKWTAIQNINHMWYAFGLGFSASSFKVAQFGYDIPARIFTIPVVHPGAISAIYVDKGNKFHLDGVEKKQAIYV